ncbi:helix-turn-helix domain-containing protein [uncultured Streptococcus sp.]|uniref:helix-turn-helix domain-containing protein n=1 Tax=uncultured Streptococcus sp. TaxID=83427 RepID=UPI0026255F5E|nr:helix-turn-helix transcriptional regulator [uncultured Streptococcus sp.]
MNRLKELRKEKKLTQQELADYMQVTRRGYQKWENGESNIKPKKAEELAKIFNVSVAYLLGYTDDSKMYDDELTVEVEGNLLSVSEKRFEEEYRNNLLKNFVRFLSDENLFLSNNEIVDIIQLLFSLSTNHGNSLKSKTFQDIFINKNHKYHKQLEKEYSFIFGDEFARDDTEKALHGYILEETRTKEKSEKLLETLKNAYGERDYSDFL